MKICIFSDGASKDAMRMLERCAFNLEGHYQVKARVFGDEENEAGIEITDPHGQSEEWLEGYVEGYSDRWGDT